jgi:Ser/Thr protein kinase RdoA (MazF antagonist)
MLPSGLSMLWESAEPQEALCSRFGFGGFTQAAEWIASSLAQEWDVTVHDCRRLVISGDNAIAWADSDRGALVIKWSRARHQFEGLAASTQLLSRLGERGLPVAGPVRTTTGADRVVLDGPVGPLSVAALPELDGHWLDVDDPAEVRAAGACLAELHLALAGYTDPRLWRPADAESVDRRVRRWLADRDPDLAPEASVRLTSLVAGLPPLPDVAQPVHNDFRAANILTHDGRIVAVLDFDEVAWDHPVSDLAKAGVYLATLFRNWQPTPDTVRRHLRTGYESVRPLAPLESRWLEALTLWQSIVAVPHAHDPAVWTHALSMIPEGTPSST